MGKAAESSDFRSHSPASLPWQLLTPISHSTPLSLFTPPLTLMKMAAPPSARGSPSCHNQVIKASPFLERPCSYPLANTARLS